MISPWSWLLLLLHVGFFIVNTGLMTAAHGVVQDLPIWLDPSSLSFRRLNEGLIEELEPNASNFYHRLRAVAVSQQDVFWVIEPCDDEGQQCLSSFASVRIMSQIISEPSCRLGIRFSLDPADPQDPLGPYFQKSFHPPDCTDVWADLLPGAIMFEVDWDLKLLLHNVNDGAKDLGPWYRTIEELSRDFPPSLSTEVLVRVWITAESIEVMESLSSNSSTVFNVLAFGRVKLRLHARSMRSDRSSPTGLIEDGPAPPALARFIELANANMEDLLTNLLSFQYLEQLVIAQEAAKFLSKQGIELPIDASLCALESPLTANVRIPAIRAERERQVSLAGVIGLQNNSWENGFWSRILEGSVEGGRAVLSQEGKHCHQQMQGRHVFDCDIKNVTTSAFAAENFDAFMTSLPTLDCIEDRSHEMAEGDIDISMTSDDPQQSAGDYDGCPEALAAWSEDEETWSIVTSEPLKGLAAEAYNITRHVIVWDGVEDISTSAIDDESHSLPIILALRWQTNERLLDAVMAKTGAIGLILVQGRSEEEEEEGGGGEDTLLPDSALLVPTRVISPDTAKDLLAWQQRDEELRFWMVCGIDRFRATQDEEQEGEDEMGPGPRNITYGGSVYRTLDFALIDGRRNGCQRGGLPLPVGYELVPAADEIVKEVVGAHRWGTSFLLLLGTEEGGGGRTLMMPPRVFAYGTATLGLRAGQRSEPVNIIVDEGSGHLQPERCDARILIRSIITIVPYAGYIYRVLEPDIPVEGVEIVQTDLPMSKQVPRAGWEIAPVSRGVVQRVVGGHPWSTDALMLADGKAYPTLMRRKRGDVTVSRYVVRSLIRRPAHALMDVGEGQFYMMDTYRADAKARLEFTRLVVEEKGQVAYLLEMKITETIMIHGGVDLTGVRRVSAAGWNDATEDLFFVSLEKEVGNGSLEKGMHSMRDASNKTYEVVKAPGLSTSHQRKGGGASRVTSIKDASTTAAAAAAAPPTLIFSASSSSSSPSNSETTTSSTS